MKKIFLLFVANLLCLTLSSQTIKGSEIGIDGALGFSTMGGSFGLGLKYGYKKTPDFIWGPSFRLMRYWSSSYTLNYVGHANIWGGGFYFHYRMQNVLYLGVESEILKNPYASINYAKTNWVPTLFLCGGFSKEYKEKIRLNVGLYYDVINNVNSPFRTSYTMKKTNPQTGQIIGYIPLIYRFSIFIPIKNTKESDIKENEDSN
ncbi:MAG: hypothetical protein HYR91_12580 [Flavobacteriia bacterium]|nr:hypothetical protein [Flavobacteriia bacterium]